MFMQYFRQSEHPIASEIYNAAYEDVEAIMGPTWFNRNRYPKELALKNILINGHICLLTADTDFGECFDEVAIPFGKDYYSQNPHFRALHFKYNNYVPTANALVKTGYFIPRNGYYCKENGRGFYTRLFPTSRLLADGMLLPEFTYDDMLDSIELRDESKMPIRYKETQRIETMSRDVDRYNKFMAPQVLEYIQAEDKSSITLFEDKEGRVKSSEPQECTKSLHINTKINTLNNNMLSINTGEVFPDSVVYPPNEAEYLNTCKSSCYTTGYPGPVGPYKLSNAGTINDNQRYPHPHNSVEKILTSQYQPISSFIKIKARRIFNNTNFGHGGRHYLPLQNLKKDERKTLLINGQPTMEPDFRALHPTMLYHQLDLHPPADCYRLFDGDGRDEMLRPVVKLLLLMMINCEDQVNPQKGKVLSGRTRAMLAFHSKWARKVKAKPETYRPFKEISKDVGLTLEEIIDRIMKVHAPIANSFFSGAGLRLQYLDSEIMRLILNQCVREKIPVIPIHDSVVCPKASEEDVTLIMQTAYLNRMKHSIEIG